jgi:heptosyltransferase-3
VVLSPPEANPLPAAAPRTVLVVVTRRIGDVLLATPLIRSVRQAWPQTAVDALVFEGTEDVLAASPDLRRVLTVPARSGRLQHLGFVLRLFRRYDLALSLVPGDRPTLYAFLAGRRRAGLLLATREEAWKRRLLDLWVPYDMRDTHTVLNHLALARALGLEPRHEVVVSWSEGDARQVDALIGSAPGAPLAVMHPHPKFNYKMWRREGWLEVAGWLAARGCRIALTGGGDAGEAAYVAALAREMPPGTLNCAGRLTLGATGCLLSRAAVYIGPDTAVTHMAAALGTPTVCFYGPTDPTTWGPWPKDHVTPVNPWRRLGSQTRGNVRLLQGDAPCAPCNREGCDRRVESYSDCLLALPASRVTAAIRDMAGI